MIKVINFYNKSSKINYLYLCDMNIFKDDLDAIDCGIRKLKRWLSEEEKLDMNTIDLECEIIKELSFSHDCLINLNFFTKIGE